MAKTNTITIDYKPKPKQLRFHQSEATECFFGGAKGPGKSKALVMDAAQYALQFPGSDPHLFRETYDILRDTLVKEFKDSIPKELYTYNEQAHEARLINGSVVKFRYVGNLDDAMQYDGRSIPYLGIDELTKHTMPVIQQLLSCMRCSKGWPVMFRATGNPGGVGHAAVKARYITPTEYGAHPYTDPLTGNVIEFIPANVYDGVLTERDPAYVRRLENLPDQRKRALLYGDWDSFEGQYFANFGPHLTQEPWKIPPHELERGAFGSMDYGPGLNGTSTFGYWYMTPEGVPIRLFTVYRRGMTASELADDIYDYVTSFHWTSGIKPTRVWCDHNMFNSARLDAESRAPIDYFREKFRGTEFVPANKQRVNGWQIVLDCFQPDTLTGKSKMYYWPQFNGHFAEFFPQLVQDPDCPGDVLKCDIDHVCDEARYGLVGMLNHGAGQKVSAAVGRDNGLLEQRMELTTILRQMEINNRIGVVGI